MADKAEIRWTVETYEGLSARLKSLADDKYKSFCEALVPGTQNMLGVRLPLLRLIAGEIAKGDFEGYLKLAGDTYYEETLLRGLVIGKAAKDVNHALRLVPGFVPRINNWAVCDSFCGSLKVFKKNPEKLFDYIKSYLPSENEFEIRFAVVMLMDYYLTDAFIDEVLMLLTGVRHDGYYVKMAVAWAYSECFIRFQDKTMELLKRGALDNFTHNKAIRKIMESRRVTEETKRMLKQMKKAPTPQELEKK